MIDKLCVAAYEGHIENIKKLITDEKVDPNGFNEFKTWGNKLPPIAWAAKNGEFEAIKVLVDLGAKINYSSSKETLAYWVMETRDWKEILSYLIAKGLQYDPAEIVLKNAYKCPLLWRVGTMDEVPFFTSIVSTKTSEELSWETFTFSVKDHGSLIDFVFDRNKSHREMRGSKAKNLPIYNVVINQMVARYILTPNVKSISDIDSCLGSKYKDVISLKPFINLYQSISLISYYEEKFPIDIKNLILNMLFSISLPDIQQDLCKELYIKFKKMSEKEVLGSRFSNIAKLSFREWRLNHNQLFFSQAPTLKWVKQTYECIVEALNESYPLYKFPLPMRKNLIQAIGKLELTDLNKIQIIKVIQKITKLEPNMRKIEQFEESTISNKK